MNPMTLPLNWGENAQEETSINLENVSAILRVSGIMTVNLSAETYIVMDAFRKLELLSACARC